MIRRFALTLPPEGPGAGPLLRAPWTEAAAFGAALAGALAAPGWLGPVAAALGLVLLALALADLRSMLLPDALTLPLLAAGLALALAAGDPLASLIGAAAGGGAGAAVALGYRALRGRDGLGWGDVKLMAAAGAWLGWAPLPWMILLAALGGIGALALARLAGRRGAFAAEAELPFGPFLAGAFWLIWLAGAG